MEVSFTPEHEAKLNRIAEQTGKAPEELVRELVASYLEQGAELGKVADEALASQDRDQFVSDDNAHLEALQRSFEDLSFRMGPKTWKREDLYDRS